MCIRDRNLCYQSYKAQLVCKTRNILRIQILGEHYYDERDESLVCNNIPVHGKYLIKKEMRLFKICLPNKQENT